MLGIPLSTRDLEILAAAVNNKPAKRSLSAVRDHPFNHVRNDAPAKRADTPAAHVLAGGFSMFSMSAVYREADKAAAKEAAPTLNLNNEQWAAIASQYHATARANSKALVEEKAKAEKVKAMTTAAGLYCTSMFGFNRYPEEAAPTPSAKDVPAESVPPTSSRKLKTMKIGEMSASWDMMNISTDSASAA
jgi:hypothetical protein